MKIKELKVKTVSLKKILIMNQHDETRKILELIREQQIITTNSNKKILTEGNLATKKTVLATQSVDTSWEAEIQLEYIDNKQTRLDMLGNWVLILQDKNEAMN